MSWHKSTLKVIDVLALLGYRCLGTHQLNVKANNVDELLKGRKSPGIVIPAKAGIQ